MVSVISCVFTLNYSSLFTTSQNSSIIVEQTHQLPVHRAHISNKIIIIFSVFDTFSFIHFFLPFFVIYYFANVASRILAARGKGDFNHIKPWQVERTDLNFNIRFRLLQKGVLKCKVYKFISISPCIQGLYNVACWV